MSERDTWRLEVERDDRLVYFYAQTREAITARREARGVADRPAAIDYWDDERTKWVEVLSYRDRDLWESADEDEDDELFSPRTLLILTVAAVPVAAVGVWWYATSPGVGSYQASSLLIVPLLLCVLVWLQRWMSARTQWVLAAGAAAIGIGGYVMVQDAQWWNWGQLAVTPLGLLALEALDRDDESRSIPGDEPWGPP